MWNSEPTLAAIAWWSLVLTAVFGGLAVATGLVGGIAADRAANLKSAADAKNLAEANARAAEANARAEEASAEAAKVNERLHKAQEMRRLTKPQADALKVVLESEVFQSDPKPTLRVSCVADAEAESFALELQNFLQSCGVNIWPTKGGLPSGAVQYSDHPTGLALAVKTLETSEENRPFIWFQHAALAVGLDFRTQIHEELRSNEGVLYILRRPPA